MQIFYKNLSGKNGIIQISDDATFRELKIIIENRSGLPYDKMRISFQCRSYPVNKKLQDVGICNDSTVAMHLKSRSYCKECRDAYNRTMSEKI